MNQIANRTTVVILSLCSLLFSSTLTQADPTAGFNQISDSYSVQKPYNLPVSARFTADNGVYTCWVYGTDKPFSEGSTTGPRTEMRWETFPQQNLTNQLAFDEMFSTGTSHTCVQQVKSDNKGDGSGGELNYLQVNDAGTLRIGEGSDFVSGIGGTWYHINSLYNPTTGLCRLYYNGSLVSSGTASYPNGNWYFKTGVYDNGMPSSAEAWVQIKNVVHWVQNFAGTYEIQCEASGLALNVQGASTANDAPVVQYPFISGQTNSEWTFIATSNGYYQINNVKSGKDLNVLHASTASGAEIGQATFGSSGDDQWLPSQNSDGSYTFYNLNSGLVLDDPGSSTSQNTEFDQWSASGGSGQKFTLIQQ